jgi:leader peptidase (prepilin peptidase) / N-methyltransferase
MEVLGAVVAGAFGAALGSFAAVVVARVPAGESPLRGRSHCVCGQPIAGYDNIPIVSYLLRRGRARCCGARIPAWYLLAELAGAGLAVALFLVLG